MVVRVVRVRVLVALSCLILSYLVESLSYPLSLCVVLVLVFGLWSLVLVCGLGLGL